MALSPVNEVATYNKALFYAAVEFLKVGVSKNRHPPTRINGLHRTQPQGVKPFLVPSERCSIVEQSIEYCAAQLSSSQKALGTLLEDGNVMPKHVGANIHN
jgi:hypothetical protein